MTPKRGDRVICIRCFQPAGTQLSVAEFYEQRDGLCADCTAAQAAIATPVQGVLGTTPIAPSLSVQQRFEEYHLANPDVYQKLVRYTRQALDAGLTKLSIWDVGNRLRWHSKVEVQDPNDPGRRLNNDYLALYSRLLMAQEPGLDGVFGTRHMKRRTA